MTRHRHQSSPDHVRGRRTVRRHRRGSATTGLLITLALMAGAVVTAIVIRPNLGQAFSATEMAGEQASDPANQQIIDGIAEIVARAHQVMAVHPRGTTPYTEIVLWVEDRENPGEIDPDEVAIISHSPVLETLIYYTLREPTEGTEPDTGRLPPTLSTGDVADAWFCDMWRTAPDIEPKVIATRVSGMQVVQDRPDNAADGRHLLRIRLTWDAQTSDSGDTAMVVVERTTQNARAQE